MHECYRGGLKTPRIVREGVNEPTILSLVSTGLGVGWVLGTARWPCPENRRRVNRGRFEDAPDVGSRMEEGQHLPSARELHRRRAAFARRASSARMLNLASPDGRRCDVVFHGEETTDNRHDIYPHASHCHVNWCGGEDLNSTLLRVHAPQACASPIPPRLQNSKLITPTSSHSYLKLMWLPRLGCVDPPASSERMPAQAAAFRLFKLRIINVVLPVGRK